MNRIVIGCDIGGVVKNNVDDSPVEGAIQTLGELSDSFRIIFISKCNDKYRSKSEQWLREYKLDRFQAFFCTDYHEKKMIAAKENVSIMIDDRMQVLSTFNDNILKIWLCNDPKKIVGIQRFQPDIFAKFSHANDWREVASLIKTYNT